MPYLPSWDRKNVKKPHLSEVPEGINVGLRIGTIPRTKTPRWLPFPLHAKLNGLLLISLLLFVSHCPQHPYLNLLERHERYDGRPEQLEDQVDVLDLLAHCAIAGAESAHAHLPCDRLPAIQHGVDLHDIFRVSPIEAESLDVVQYEVTLGELVEHEINHLRPVLLIPRTCDLGNGLQRHPSLVFLDDQVVVGRGADHKLDVGIELGLLGWTQRDGKGRSRHRRSSFRRRLSSRHGYGYELGKLAARDGGWDEFGNAVGLL